MPYFFLVEPIAETLRSPVATFCLLLAISLIIPPIFERLKLPGLVGLILAGVVFGGSGLGWLDNESETMGLLSEIGKIYLMFVAGLEIDLLLFRRTKHRSIGFGMMTFSYPMLGGIALGLFFGFGWLPAVLIGSLLASHTLLAYPIVQRYGIVDDEAVTVTIGATIFTDIGSLLVLAICLGINQGDFSIAKLATLLGSLVVYTFGVLVGLKQLGKLFFRKFRKDEGNRFLFVLLSVFLCAVTAQLIGVENIIGAFLAGLAINDIIGDGPVQEKTEFIGRVLFIPIFFIDMGLLLDLEAFRSILSSVGLPIAIVVTLLLMKLAATLTAKQCYGYSWTQAWAMWSLSIPQVAATLAAALVAYQADIINTAVFNSVVLMMLVTSILGPLVTTAAAKQLVLQRPFSTTDRTDWLAAPHEVPESFSIVVPVHNPHHEKRLLELAASVAQFAKGRLIPVSIALAQPHMDSPLLTKALTRSRERLEAAKAISEDFETVIQPELRIEDDVAHAIAHVSREKNANLIILGMAQLSKFQSFNGNLFNTIQNEVMRIAHCPVVIARLLDQPAAIKTILIPLETPSGMALRVLRFAQVLAMTTRAKITLLHVCSPRSSEKYRAQMTAQMDSLIAKLPPAACEINSELLIREDVVSAIAKAAAKYDLVILRAQRRRLGQSLTLGMSTVPILQQLSGSVIVMGEPPLHAPEPALEPKGDLPILPSQPRVAEA
jgi:Kef-type K+ transport system membrane component KefB/nucleotide-binding universal stress UspA family protein